MANNMVSTLRAIKVDGMLGKYVALETIQHDIEILSATGTDIAFVTDLETQASHVVIRTKDGGANVFSFVSLASLSA